MCAVPIGVQQADRDRLHIVFPAAANVRGQFREVEFFDLSPVGVQSLTHFEAEFARNKRGGLCVSEVVNVGPVRALDFEHIPKAARGEKRGSHALSFGKSVNHDG
jgi:hypothetical protein